MDVSARALQSHHVDFPRLVQYQVLLGVVGQSCDLKLGQISRTTDARC